MRATLAKYPLEAFIYCGRDEREARQTPIMARLLKAEDADARWAVYPGGHSWSLWAAHADQMLIMASRYFARRRASAV